MNNENEHERVGFNRPEPDPPTNSEHNAVWDLFFENFSPTMRVTFDIRNRDRAGAAKYGTRLRIHNQRNPKVDLYQELLDAIAYASQDYFEHPLPRPPHLYARIKRLVAEAEEVEAELFFAKQVAEAAAERPKVRS